VYSVRSRPGAATIEQAPEAVEGPAPTYRDYGLWLLLSGMGSFMLLAVTNHITHDVASVPFLWILPLTIYLLTFILCFEGRGWYRRAIFVGPLLVVVCAMAWALHEDRALHDIREGVALFSIGLFVCCMFFHGELAAVKPAPRYLTTFYLMVSLGGALGGFVVGFVAPRAFPTYYEFGAGLVVTLAVAAFVLRRLPFFVPLLAVSAAGFSGYHVYQYIDSLSSRTLVMKRNFYGTLRVREVRSGDAAVRQLMHGVIMHGEQYVAPARHLEPSTYYGATSGVALALNHLPRGPRRVAVIGLGTGTMAAHGRKGDVFRFYELNPEVIRIARSQFSYLDESPARIETVLGDARLSMEREPPQGYDLIVIDAFSSDAIPVHLITREAMAVYLKHLKPDGVIAFHVTNRFLRLSPVVNMIAEEYRLAASLIVDEAADSELAKTDWVLVTRNPKFLAHADVVEATTAIETIPNLAIWTDSHNNLFRILK
jgi:SAM-dependent methyltransferase